MNVHTTLLADYIKAKGLNKHEEFKITDVQYEEGLMYFGEKGKGMRGAECHIVELFHIIEWMWQEGK